MLEMLKMMKDEQKDGGQGLSEDFLSKLKEKMNEKGKIKITIEGWEAGDPSISEEVNEFILFARIGRDATFKAASSKAFNIMAINEIKEKLLESL